MALMVGSVLFFLPLSMGVMFHSTHHPSYGAFLAQLDSSNSFPTWDEPRSVIIIQVVFLCFAPKNRKRLFIAYFAKRPLGVASAISCQ